MTTERLAQLRENLIEYFDLEELRTLCFDLGVDYDALRGEGKESKARELLSYLERHGRICHLVEQCNQLRPNVVWQEILAAVEAESPFKGLEYFDATDADLFFGRESLTAQLVARLAPSPLKREGRGEGGFLAVVGASGSGKSSVVRAGLVAALRRGDELTDDQCRPVSVPEGCRQWPIHVITPTAHPLKELAASLTREAESVTATTALMDDLARDSRSLDLAVSKLLKQSGKGNRLLLVVDQFEELFTVCKDEAERKAFVDNLLYAVAPETEGPTIVVIALRADFYAHCGKYANLRDALEKHQAYIGPMSAEELHRAIEEPARRNGWEFEPGLVDLILRDVGDEPGALPLLSHALLETWKRRVGRTLTLTGYHESGGVRGAIAKTADDVYSHLTSGQQLIAREIFLRLSGLGEGTPDTRRRVELNALIVRPEDKPAVESVLKTLADARLITTGKDTVEVAHEALIANWEQLQGWLNLDREFLLWRQRLDGELARWQIGKGMLLYDAALIEAERWLSEQFDKLDCEEVRFIQTSLARQNREQTTRKRSLMSIVVGISFVAIVLAVMSGVAIFQARQAETQKRMAVARQLNLYVQGLMASGNYDHQSPLITALLAESVQHYPAPESSIPLRSALDMLPRRLAHTDYGNAVLATVLSPDRRMVATVEDCQPPCSGIVHIWNTRTGQEVSRLAQGVVGPWQGHFNDMVVVSFSPDGRFLASGGRDKTARVWDVTTGREIAHTVHEDVITALTFSPDNRLVASTDKNRTTLIWEAETGHDIARISSSNTMDHIAFANGGELLITAEGDCNRRVTIILPSADSQNTPAPTAIPEPCYESIRAWDARTGHEVYRITQEGNATNLAVSPDGKWIILYNHNSSIVRVLVSATGQEIGRIEHEDKVQGLVLGPDGQLGAIWGQNNILVWKLASGERIAQFVHDDDVTQVVFSPDGKLIASASKDKTVRVWEANTGQEITRVAHRGAVVGIDFSADGTRILSRGEDKIIHVWWATTGRELACIEHIADVSYVAFGATGDTVLSVEKCYPQTSICAETLQVWRVEPGNGVISAIASEKDVTSIAFSPDDKYLVSGSSNGVIRIWDLSAGHEVTRVTYTKGVDSAAFISEGSRILAGNVCSHRTSEGMLNALRLLFGETSFETATPTPEPCTATAAIWEKTTQRIQGVISSQRQVRSVAFSGDGKLVAWGSDDGTVEAWNINDKEMISHFTHGYAVTALAFSLDGHLLASGEGCYSMGDTPVDYIGYCPAAIWISDIGRSNVTTIVSQTGMVTAITFSPDGRWIASGSENGDVTIWEATTGHLVRKVSLGGNVSSLVFSPDGKWMASANNSTVTVWDTGTGRKVFLQNHENSVSALTFSSDGKWIASAGGNTVWVWLWQPKDLLAEVCARMRRNLTREEWQDIIEVEPYRPACPNLP